MNLKRRVRQIPLLGDWFARVYVRLAATRFNDSSSYWEKRYAKGGNSGDGSYGELAAFKAEFLNSFVAARNISTVIEFGCGDGNQLRFAEYASYIGVDISPTAIEQCRALFRDDETKKFVLLTDYDGTQAELSLSLDVIYHLVEDEVFDSHMRNVFESAKRFVVVYASNTDEQYKVQSPHVRHRKFTDWIDRHAPNWKLVDHVSNPMPFDARSGTGSFANFFVFATNDQRNQ